MDFFLSSPTSTIATVFAFLIFLYILFFGKPKVYKKNNGNNKIAPQAAGAWPLIGHIHLLSGPQPPHIVLGSMADKYGPIFTIKTGMHQALVVSDWKTAKTCFTTNDKAFAARPKFIAGEFMSYNYSFFGLSPYGPYWRYIRKIVVLELLSNHRIEMLAHIRVSELKCTIKDVYEFWFKNKDGSNFVKLEMKELLGNLILNVVVRMLVGKHYSSMEEEEAVQFHKAMRKFFELLGSYVVSDAFPYLKWLDLGGHIKVMKKTAKEMDEVLEMWLKEHKMRRNSGQVKGEPHDFMDAMITILDGAPAEEFAGFDADTINKATCLTLLSGGADTTTVTLVWAFSLLLNNRHVLKKAQDELDIYVGRDRWVKESDIKNLVYLQAIIKETLRLYPAGPLGVPHAAAEDCILDGYNIPKGTHLMVNLWKIHRDPQIWSDPNDFLPERFLTSHKEVDIRGQHFELIPFGSGRRICPGLNFGLQAVQLTVASLIQGFEFATPTEEPIDMSESIGLTNLKATPLEVLLTPRLSSNLYA